MNRLSLAFLLFLMMGLAGGGSGAARAQPPHAAASACSGCRENVFVKTYFGPAHFPPSRYDEPT
jgi:hypothetical protein